MIRTISSQLSLKYRGSSTSMHKREIRALLSSMLLGDGSLSCKYNAHRKGQPINDLTGVGITYHMSHQKIQEDFLRWKISEINRIFEEKNLDRRCSKLNEYIDKRTNKLTVQTHLSWTKYFRHIYPKIYKIKDNKRIKTIHWLLKQIYNDKHLFIWFGDDGCEMKKQKLDGSYSNISYRLHTNNFTKGEVEIARQWFHSNYNIQPRIMMWKGGSGKLSPVLMFRKTEAQVIWNHISPYVKQIPSIREKFIASTTMWD